MKKHATYPLTILKPQNRRTRCMHKCKLEQKEYSYSYTQCLVAIKGCEVLLSVHECLLASNGYEVLNVIKTYATGSPLYRWSLRRVSPHMYTREYPSSLRGIPGEQQQRTIHRLHLRGLWRRILG